MRTPPDSRSRGSGRAVASYTGGDLCVAGDTSLSRGTRSGWRAVVRGDGRDRRDDGGAAAAAARRAVSALRDSRRVRRKERIEAC